jgi:hypothetical protein
MIKRSKKSVLLRRVEGMVDSNTTFPPILSHVEWVTKIIIKLNGERIKFPCHE